MDRIFIVYFAMNTSILFNVFVLKVNKAIARAQFELWFKSMAAKAAQEI